MKEFTIYLYPDITSPVGQRLDLTWEGMAVRCTLPRRATHTVAQYQAMDDAQRRKAKAGPAFLGARTADGRRRKDSIEAYTLVCLDLDHCRSDVVDTLCNTLREKRIQSVVYSTHSSTPQQPRLRLVINPSREMTCKEYPVVCQRIAGLLTAACNATDQTPPMFDPSAWSSAHVFFWPTCPSDAPFIGERIDGEPLCVEEYLTSEKDEAAPQQAEKPAALSSSTGKKKQQRPAEYSTSTAQGAFNAVYGVERAIKEFLGDVYRYDAATGRYTYIPGEGEAGLVILDEHTAFSHHGSDPACGHPLSAYMIVAVHRFGVNPTKRSKRQKEAMDKWVMTLQEVREAVLVAKGADPSQMWILDLESDATGRYLSSRPNVGKILTNDPQVAGTFYLDTFAHRLMYRPERVFAQVGGDGGDAPRAWEDVVDSRLRYWLEQTYGITGKDTITDAVMVTAEANPVHPVRDYLNALQWDGTERVQSLFIDYLGAEDNPLNRYFAKMFMVGAVARVMNPGCKFDYCPVLCGRQGIGKSMVLNILGGAWFTDALMDLRDKDGLMVIQGRWIVEIGELKALKRAEDFDAKSFLTILEDRFRPPYGRYMVDYPRQCVFAATTNEEFFLKSSDGNRRFVPVHCDGTTVYPDVAAALDALRENRDQMWAEAMAVWRDGMELYLPPELEQMARTRQQQVNENMDDPLRDALNQFISTPRPADWYTYSVVQRYSWYHSPHTEDDLVACQLPTRVSVPEVLQEVVGARPSDRDYTGKSRRLGRYIKELEGWKHVGTSRHTNTLYNGTVKAWEREL